MNNKIYKPIAEMTDDEINAIASVKISDILNPENQLMDMAGAFVESLMMVHNIPTDFDGLSLHVLRCPDTHRLMAVVITPVDMNADAEPKVRYNVDPGKLRRADMPKIVLAG